VLAVITLLLPQLRRYRIGTVVPATAASA